MIPKALRSFMSSLFKATEDQTVSWSDGAHQNSYFCAHKSYNLHLFYHFDDATGVASYNFRLSGNNKDAGFIVNSEEDEFDFMRNLFSSISVNASKLGDIEEDFFD